MTDAEKWLTSLVHDLYGRWHSTDTRTEVYIQRGARVYVGRIWLPDRGMDAHHWNGRIYSFPPVPPAVDPATMVDQVVKHGFFYGENRQAAKLELISRLLTMGLLHRAPH